MLPEKFKTDKWMLTFSPEIEQEYQKRNSIALEPTFKLSIKVFLALIFAIFLMDYFGEDSPLNNIRVKLEFLYIALFTVLLIFTGKIQRAIAASGSPNKIVTALTVVCLGSHLLILYHTPPTDFVNPYGITLLVLLVNTFIPYSFHLKLIVGLIYSLTFIYIIVSQGFFSSTPPFILARQVMFFYLIHGVLSYVIEHFVRRQGALAMALDEESEKVDELLLNILPESIASRLKAGEENIFDKADNVTIIFADLVGFTEMSSKMPPAKVVKILNDIFSRFDLSAEMFGVEKIKTMGDNYFAASGIPEPCDDHAERIARLALEFSSALDKYSKLMDVDLKLRIGINTGPVLAGVIGTKKFLYDLWGDTVNLASRMESHGEPTKIQITKATKDALGDKFLFSEPRVVDIKGKGPTETFFLLGEAD